MRSRINLLVIGVASLIVIAFVVPLGLAVRQQADQRGRITAERTAQTLTAVVVRSTAAPDSLASSENFGDLIGPIPEGSAVVLPDGTTLGPALPDQALIEEVGAARTALSAYSDDGFGLAIPVVTQGGTVVVYSSVDSTVLVEGVARAWMLLGMLGLALILASLFVADRLGRTVVGPSIRISSAAERLGQGDLGSRVAEEGPPELVSIAAAFNVLANRIEGLLAEERESLADLSHRLRTPLTALRLQVEQLPGSDEKRALLEKVDLLGSAVNDLIRQARTRSDAGPKACDVSDVVARRSEFWQVLATDQGRDFKLDIGESPLPVAVGEVELAAAFDALIGNVFAHTPSGTAFGVAVRDIGELVEIEVADNGPGFAPGFDPTDRGISGVESSGLGLDIARQFAASAGGSIKTSSSPLGGARIVVELPLLA